MIEPDFIIQLTRLKGHPQGFRVTFVFERPINKLGITQIHDDRDITHRIIGDFRGDAPRIDVHREYQAKVRSCIRMCQWLMPNALFDQEEIMERAELVWKDLI